MDLLHIEITHGGYEKSKNIIQQIQFDLPPGQLVGLIGSNGAGKSTTIQAMMGTLPELEATIELPRYGYVPERPILYEHFTLSEHIDFLIRTVEQDETALKKRADALCDLFQLSEKLQEFPTTFSKGMQQKVMLILAFTPTYELYIVDEPFMGLDPRATRRLIQLLEQLKQDGAALLMSTHALDTAEKICDTFVLVDGGTILKKGSLEEIKAGVTAEDDSLLAIFDALLEAKHT